MDLLTKHINSKVFCDRIMDSHYTQKGSDITTNIRAFPTFINLLFSNFDHHYSMIENRDKDLYIKQRVLDIATEIDEDKDNRYDNFNYLKSMNSTLIQQGLQSMNSISALLYLGDYYSVSFTIFLEGKGSTIKTSDKVRKEFNIMYTTQGKWAGLDSPPEYENGEFKDLGLCFNLDVTTKDIYKKYLTPIGKYKSPELIEIAKSLGLPLMKDGKKKVKKELYDDINLYQLNLK